MTSELDQKANDAQEELSWSGIRVLSTEFKQYLAGFIDSDGCIGLKTRHGPELRACQSFKKIDILHFIKEQTGIGEIYLTSKAKKDHLQDGYMWIIGAEKAVDIVTQILPHLIEKYRLGKVVAGWICGRTQDVLTTVHEHNNLTIVKTTTFTSKTKAAAYMGSNLYKVTTMAGTGRIAPSRKLRCRVSVTCNTELCESIKQNHNQQWRLWIEVLPQRPEVTGMSFPLRYSVDLDKINLQSITMPYAAGFAEGDGSFCVIQNNKSASFSLRCDITQKDAFIPVQFLRFFKVGVIYHHTSKMANKEVLFHCYKWTVTGQQAKEYMQMIRPYIVSHAVKQQIDIIMSNGVNQETRDMIKQYKA